MNTFSFNPQSTPAQRRVFTRPAVCLIVLFAALLTLLSWGAVSPAAAQDGGGEAAGEQTAGQNNGIQMDAAAAYGGVFKYGEWLPVWVTLENSGADLEAEVQVRVQRSTTSTVFSVPVSLPAGARKRLPVYVLPNNFTREVEVRLVSGDELVASQRVSVQPQANISYLIGVASANQGAISQLKGLELPGQARPVALFDVALEDLPERQEGLRSLDLLIFNDIDTSSLTPGQAGAIQAWVSTGGRLVIGGGAGAAKTTSGLPEELLPLEPSGVVDLEGENLAGLADFAGAIEIQAAGPFLAATGLLQDGELLAGDENLPLVTSKSFGSGAVDFISLDLSTSPFEGWSGTASFWEALIGPGGSYPEGLPPDMSPRQLRASSMPYSLGNMPVLDLPSVRSLGLLLGAYILLVGPVNYLVLKHRKKLHWAWISIPLITVLFSASAFAMGYSLRGTDVVLNKIALVELNPAGQGEVTTYMGLFSPGQEDYEVAVEGGSLLSPIVGYEDPWAQVPSGTGGEMVFVQSDPGAVRGLTVGQWSMQNFMAESTWPDFGNITTDLDLDGGVISGTVRNDTGHTLEDVTVVLRKNFVRLGSLEPGQSAEVMIPFQTGQEDRFGMSLSWKMYEQQLNAPGASAREAEMKRSIVESVFERGIMSPKSSLMISGGSGTGGELYVLGWMRTAPPEVQVSGRTPGQQTTTLVYLRTDFQIPDTERLDLPPGLIPGALVQSPVEGGYCGDINSTGVYLASGEAIFEFRVPAQVRHYQAESLTINLWTDMGWWQSPEVGLWDWQEEDWRPVENAGQGDNQVPEAEDLVSDAGTVRLRLAGDNMQGCIFVDLGMQGVQRDGQGG